MKLTGQLLCDLSALSEHRAAWDDLAVATGRPYCAPGWLLPWWEHVRPEGARPRVVLALEDGRLVGLAPLWVEGRTYRLFGAKLAAPVEPLAAPGREREVAATLAATLAKANPAAPVVRLEGGSDRLGWARLLADRWPAAHPPWLYSADPVTTPTVNVAGLDYDGWLATKSRNFRSRARRLRRKLEEAGGTFLLSSPAEVERHLDAFSRLHHARWAHRGGSAALNQRVEKMLRGVATELMDSGRFRLYVVEAGGSVISAHLFLAAGGEVAYWNGGFDDAWGEYSPSVLTLLEAVADAMARGEKRVNLGPGAQEYKYRLADAEQPLTNETLVPRGAGHLRGRLDFVPAQARFEASRRLSLGTKARLRRLLRR